MNAVDTAVFGELTHHQPVFTTADVIKTTGGSPVWATQSLSALAKEGLIAKVRRGLWALPGHADFSPYAIIPQLLRATKGEKTDVRGYVSLLSALNLHGMIDQAPHVIQIVAERIRPTVRTPFGTYQFHRLDPALIGGYGPYRNTGNFDIATPAKALFDALYLSTRRGRRLRHFPELSWPANFSRRELREWIAKIDDSKLRVAVTEQWDVLRHKSQP
jgi:predicted transcriptional regulator of viral defense system